MNKPSFRLSHRPLGIEHPYHQDPDERFPRHPEGGDKVVLGVRSFPAGTAKEVWALWGNGDEEQRSEGVLVVQGGAEAEILQFATSTLRLGDTEVGDTWHIRMPDGKGDAEVRYRVFGRFTDGTKQETIELVPVEYRVRQKMSSGEVEYVQTDPTGIKIGFLNKVGFRSILKLDLSKNGIAIELAKSKTGDERPIENSDSTELRPVVWQEGEIKIEVFPHPFSLRFSSAGKEKLSLSSIPNWTVLGDEMLPVRCDLRWAVTDDEKFFGTGERYRSFNLRGNKLDSQVYEQYKGQDLHTYLPVPFYLSSSGYAVYWDTKRPVRFDFAGQDENALLTSVEFGGVHSVTGSIYLSDDPKENIRAFSKEVGTPRMLPDWAFGHWMSSNEWNDQKTVLEQLALSKEHDIPASVIVIEAWADETTFYVWNDAKYEPKPSDQPMQLADFRFPKDGKWPDPKGMIDECHNNGVKMVLWQNPVLKYIGEEQHAQQKIDEGYMLEHGYHVKWADGSPYKVRPFWFHDSLLMDFTNPEAVAWWMSKRAYLLDEMGVDGFKTDGGEHLWGQDTRFWNGMKGDEGINEYPNLYVGAYYDFANQKTGGKALTFSRAGFTGAQKYPCHWAGDENSTWEAYRASLNAGLSAGISGIPFWGWDIAGFSGEVPSVELYLRSAAMAAFCPIMQFHSEFNDHKLPLRDRTPWNIAERSGDPKVIDVYRKFVKHRYELMDYILKEAEHCVTTGEPMMRALFLDWPGDEATWGIDDEYCFGRGILVAPILTPGISERKVYLPQGKWRDHWTGEELIGGQWITVPAPLDIIPAFDRLDR